MDAICPGALRTLGRKGGPFRIGRLAAFQYGLKEPLVDVTVGARMPRLPELLGHLGAALAVVSDDGETAGFGVPNIPLDPRCPQPGTITGIPIPDLPEI
jgi:hypothetical protein